MVFDRKASTTRSRGVKAGTAHNTAFSTLDRPRRVALEPAIPIRSQILGCHVPWLWSAASGEVEAWCLPFGCIPFGLAFGDLAGDPSGDITTGWRRAERIDIVAGRRLGMVDSGGPGSSAVEGGGEPIESTVATLVGEVGALFILVSGVGEVEGVGLPAAAHRHVGPFPVGVPTWI